MAQDRILAAVDGSLDLAGVTCNTTLTLTGVNVTVPTDDDKMFLVTYSARNSRNKAAQPVHRVVVVTPR